jgi:hypothetical protein
MNHSSTAQANSITEQVVPAAAVGLSGMKLNAVKVSEVATEAETGLAFPGNDCGQSLAEMAQRDLDAALQLLADRAQYITGASGAAIALRQEGEQDMLCRASAGTNAPELGALLSAEFGLSGESVRTRQPLRCDDAERDGRVNRESCRELGIASVAVMPVVSDDEVIGVFELFSGQANAFSERDVVALQRLAEMVETAARFARAAEEVLRDPEHKHLGSNAISPAIGVAEVAHLPVAALEIAEFDPTKLESKPELEIEPKPDVVASDVSAAEQGDAVEHTATDKPFLWFEPAADGDVTDSDENASGEALLEDESLKDENLPFALRSLRRCKACGFPVSESRTLCLDCEEKNWRGKIQASAKPPRVPGAVVEIPAAPPAAAQTEKNSIGELSATVELPEDDMPIFSAEEASPSWLAANKYVLGAVVAAALAIGAVLLLR